MDALYDRQQRLYGYDTRTVDFDWQDDGTVKVNLTEIKTLPTAAAIEAAYDHSKHPNALVTGGKG